MRKLAFAIALTTVAPFSAHATTQTVSFSSAGAAAFGVASTSCSFVDAYINVAKNGAQNLNAPSTTGFAFAYLTGYNFCSGSFSFFFEYGSTSTFTFAAPGAPNVLPQSVQASGSIPMYCSGCSSSSDTLTFSIALQPVGTATYEQTGTVRSSYPPGVTVDQHFDFNSAYATTGTVTLSSQNFGTIPVANGFAGVNDQKVHTITITY
jgi:hypothetical protein